MAELYLARRRGVQGFEKLVAIKRILPHLAEDPVFVDMFVHEARVAARLSHVNICQVHELEQIDDELLLVMEFYFDEQSTAIVPAPAPSGTGATLNFVGRF
jgi:serine/threonine-protein kinase